MKLKVGMKVKLSAKGAARWGCGGDDPSNPINLVGVLAPKTRGNTVTFPYAVDWSNGFDNVYREGDLEAVAPRMEENE